MDNPPSGTVDRGRAEARRGPSLGLVLLAAATTVGLGVQYGFVRAFIAVLMFLAIAIFGARQIRSMLSIPPEPEIADVRGYGLRYVCTMCGLELKIEKAAKDKAPTHCMEPMVLTQAFDDGGVG